MSIRSRLDAVEARVRELRLGECPTCHGVRLGWTFPDGTGNDGSCPTCHGEPTLRWEFGPAEEVGLPEEIHPPEEPMPC